MRGYSPSKALRGHTYPASQHHQPGASLDPVAQDTYSLVASTARVQNSTLLSPSKVVACTRCIQDWVSSLDPYPSSPVFLYRALCPDSGCDCDSYVGFRRKSRPLAPCHVFDSGLHNYRHSVVRPHFGPFFPCRHGYANGQDYETWMATFSVSDEVKEDGLSFCLKLSMRHLRIVGQDPGGMGEW